MLSIFAYNAIAVELVGGTGFDSAPGFPFSLVSVNRTTGQLTPITPANGNYFFTGLDVAPDHTLYGVGQDLFKIDATSGAVTDIGPLSASPVRVWPVGPAPSSITPFDAREFAK